MSKSDGLNRREALVAGLGGVFMLTANQANAQGQTTLTFWTVRLNTPELAAALKPILADFEAENPGIKDQARARLGQFGLSEIPHRHSRPVHA